MNLAARPAAPRETLGTLGRDHRYDRVPPFTWAPIFDATKDEVEEALQDSRGASWNSRLHFLFSVWTSEGECFLLRYSVQSSARANARWCTVGVTTTIARHDALHFTSRSTPPQDPSSIPPANFRSNLLGRRLRRTRPRKNGIVPFLLRGRNGYLKIFDLSSQGILAL